MAVQMTHIYRNDFSFKALALVFEFCYVPLAGLCSPANAECWVQLLTICAKVVGF